MADAVPANEHLGTAAGPADRFIDHGPVRLHFLDWPSSAVRTMILLHGGGLTAHTWDQLAPLLSDDVHCLAPALRGHGDSDWAVDGDYSLAGYVADLSRLVQELELARFVLVGMSLGGLIAMQYATRAVETLDALVLVDEGLSPVAAGQRQIRQLLAGPRRFRSLDELLDRLVGFNPRRSRTSLAKSVRHNLRQDGDGTWSWKYDPVAIDAMVRGTYAGARDRLRTDLEAISCPTLVVRGSESAVFSAEAAIELTALLPDADMVTIDGAGHGVQGDRPRELAAAIRAFMSDRLGDA